jgi:hypothetical protein
MIKAFGISFKKEFFKDKTLQQFKELYFWQAPFRNMVPKERDKALRSVWAKLEDKEPKKKKKELEE